jgi:hypothetical protein
MSTSTRTLSGPVTLRRGRCASSVHARLAPTRDEPCAIVSRTTSRMHRHRRAPTAATVRRGTLDRCSVAAPTRSVLAHGARRIAVAREPRNHAPLRGTRRHCRRRGWRRRRHGFDDTRAATRCVEGRGLTPSGLRQPVATRCVERRGLTPSGLRQPVATRCVERRGLTPSGLRQPVGMQLGARRPLAPCGPLRAL